MVYMVYVRTHTSLVEVSSIALSERQYTRISVVSGSERISLATATAMESWTESSCNMYVYIVYKYYGVTVMNTVSG